MNVVKQFLFIAGILTLFYAIWFYFDNQRNVSSQNVGAGSRKPEFMVASDVAECVVTILEKRVPTNKGKMTYQTIFKDVYKGFGYTVSTDSCTPGLPLIPLSHRKQCGDIFRNWSESNRYEIYKPPLKTIPSELRSAFTLNDLIAINFHYRNDIHNSPVIKPQRWTHEVVQSYLQTIQSGNWTRFSYGSMDTGTILKPVCILLLLPFAQII